MKTFSVKTSREFRGITYLQNGQQFQSWLPAGSYAVVGKCLVRYSNLGTVSDVDAVKLERTSQPNCGEHWYVGLATVPPELLA